MGGNNSKPKPENEKLNTSDLKSAAAFAVSGGKTSDANQITEKDFAIIFEAKAKAAGLMSENETFDQVKKSYFAQEGSKAMVSTLDVNGDGKVDAKDFEIMFKNYNNFLDKNQQNFDDYLPFVGQCAFGVTSGFFAGYFTRSLWSYKIPIGIVSVGTYTGVQYLAQQDFINKEQIIETAKKKVSEALDVNKDGSLDRKDLEQLIENKMTIVNKKLGPGGLAPGVVGYVTFGLGMLYGMRPRRVR